MSCYIHFRIYMATSIFGLGHTPVSMSHIINATDDVYTYGGRFCGRYRLDVIDIDQSWYVYMARQYVVAFLRTHSSRQLIQSS